MDYRVEHYTIEQIPEAATKGKLTGRDLRAFGDWCRTDSQTYNGIITPSLEDNFQVVPFLRRQAG